MKKKLLIFGGLTLVLLIAGFIGITNGLSDGAKVTLHGIDLANIADGDYTGIYEFKRWSNTVSVQVKDHAITEIEIVKDVFASQITNCSGEVFRRVIEAQNTTVDAVSGATVTSKAYLKAIENALNP
ncbi:MAG: FMN-binding protein [Oscillospiraceae bacterium]|nr:FMN-binding protein [Oscillospiraceae bacterium]